MSKKLELNHLAAYLPHRLDCAIIDGSVDDCDNVEMLGINIDYVTLDASNKFDYNFNEIAPILHPLSDLTKEIEIGGEGFIPIVELGFENKKDIANSLIFTIKNLHVPYCEMQKLLEWHFDIFDLIDSDLAIDINKL